MAGVLSSSGLASGIDTKAIVDALINADRSSTAVLEKTKTAAQARLDAMLGLRTKLLAAQDAVDLLRKSESYSATKATSGNATALGATGTTSANPGSYVVSVKQLAQAHQLVTGDVASPLGSATDPNGTGSLTIKIGAGVETTLNFDPSNSSLTGIAAAVNAAKLGVTASVVHDGAGYRLTVQSNLTGTANAITEFNGSGGLATLFPSDVDGKTTLRELAAAKDAQLRLGDPLTGLLVTKASNTITDVIPGVTLVAKTVADNVTVDVARDATATKDKIKSFITAMNGAVSQLNSNTTFNAATKTAGPLLADSDLRRSLNEVVGGLFEGVAGQPTGYGSLASLGVSIDQKTGLLSLDEAVFDGAYAANPQATETLFTASANTAKDRLNAMTDSTLGQIYFKTDGLKTSIAEMTKQITKADERLAQRRERYEREFQQMEKLINASKAQGTSVTNFITSLQAQKG